MIKNRSLGLCIKREEGKKKNVRGESLGVGHILHD